jgi:hypothetical protein
MSYTNGPKIVTDGLVLCLDAANRKSYPGSGTTWNDLSGNGNVATLVNGVGYNSNNGGSLTFDGVDDYAITSTITNYKSLNMWVYLDSKFAYLLDARTGSPNGYFWFPGLDANFGPDWDQFYVNGQSVSLSLSNIPTNVWFNFYIRNTGIRTGTINLFNRYTNVENQAGKYSLFSAYNRALLDSEILQNYNATKGRFGL